MTAVNKRMSHEERRERRRRMAKDVGAGVPLTDVAQIYGVGLYTVYFACREAGVETHNYKSVSSVRSFYVLKYLLDHPKSTMSSLAAELNIGRERVAQIARRAVEAGWDVKQVGQ